MHAAQPSGAQADDAYEVSDQLARQGMGRVLDLGNGLRPATGTGASRSGWVPGPLRTAARHATLPVRSAARLASLPVRCICAAVAAGAAAECALCRKARTYMNTAVVRRRTLELAREYRSIGKQCYVLPDSVTTSADAIRDYLIHARSGGQRPADSVDSADGDVEDQILHQQTRKEGDGAASAGGGLRGRRLPSFEFHRMSSYRCVMKTPWSL